MEEVRISEWPEPPGSHAWLPAYGFQHDLLDKDDYFGTNGDNGSTHALYLETIVEETSDDLRSERSSAATWLSDSDADSVIHVRGVAGSECDSESEREWACPAKRRRRERACSPTSTGSLSRSSSLAQFESLERSCAAPASPSLSPDSLESPPASPPPSRAPPPRTHLSAENLSEDSGYSERSRRPPPSSQRRPPEIASRPPASATSVPCLAASPAPERRPPRAARSLSLPAELDVCAEPRRPAPEHRARFRQSFEVSDSLTVSVADLTALDYRGGPRRPRLPPPPPPPRAPRNPPPPPPVEVITHRVPEPPAPVREPSAGSDSTTESERAFAREMETTARRLDETARRALAGAGDFERELSVLTARRLRDSWGAWDDVLDELRRRIEPSSPSPSPPRSPSPDPIREPTFTSTPLRCTDARVRSTPELRARATPQRETPEELRASLQLVAPAPTAPPARSVSTGSKGVTFSPVVAEVSWRETSASTATESTASDDANDAEVEEVEGGGEEPRAPAAERASVMTEAGARAPRSRIAGFLSRFANFRFSGRKEKKSRGAGANSRPATASNGVSSDAGAGARGPAAGPQYVRIPLKEEGVSRAAAPPVAGGVAHKPPRPRPPPAPAPGVLETDVDTQRTVLHARSLLALAPPDQRAPRPHKSMEFLLDKDSAQIVQVESDTTEGELEVNTTVSENENSNITSDTQPERANHHTDQSREQNDQNAQSSVQTTNKRTKKRKKTTSNNADDISDETLSEAFQLLQQCAQPLQPETDSYIAFGQYISTELRKYDAVTLVNVKNAICQVIFQADTGRYGDSNYGYYTNSYPGTPIASTSSQSQSLQPQNYPAPIPQTSPSAHLASNSSQSQFLKPQDYSLPQSPPN